MVLARGLRCSPPCLPKAIKGRVASRRGQESQSTILECYSQKKMVQRSLSSAFESAKEASAAPSLRCYGMSHSASYQGLQWREDAATGGSGFSRAGSSYERASSSMHGNSSPMRAAPSNAGPAPGSAFRGGSGPSAVDGLSLGMNSLNLQQHLRLLPVASPMRRGWSWPGA